MIVNILSSDKTSWYQVRYQFSKWTCNCPHFMFRLKGKSPCKHIDEAKRLHGMSLDQIFDEIDWSDPTPSYKIPG